MGSGLNKIFVFTEEQRTVLWVGAKQFPEPFQIVYNEPPEP